MNFCWLDPAFKRGVSLMPCSAIAILSCPLLPKRLTALAPIGAGLRAGIIAAVLWFRRRH